MSVTAEKPLVTPAGVKSPFDIYRPEKRITHLKIGIYGDPGVGKTTLAATAPKPLFLNAEAGDVALRNKEVDIIKIEDFAMVQKIHDWLRAGKHDYQTVVIDSLTEFHRRSMDTVLRNAGREMPHQADWGHSMEYIRRLVRKFRDLEMHTVFIHGAMFREDIVTGQSEYMPNLPGKLGPEISGYYDILGFMLMERDPRTKEYVRRLRVQPTPKFKAKDRTSTLGAYLEGDQLNLTDVIEMVNGEEKHVTIEAEDIVEPK